MTPGSPEYWTDRAERFAAAGIASALATLFADCWDRHNESIEAAEWYAKTAEGYARFAQFPVWA